MREIKLNQSILKSLPLSKKHKIILSLLALLVFALSLFSYIRYTQTPEYETAQTIKKIARHIQLPAAEMPSIATVKNQSKLKPDPFFQKAQNGDKMLIYTKSAKIILYRPSVDKVIDVATLAITKPTVTPAKPKEITATIYNGTSVVGLGGNMEKELTVQYPSMKVKDVVNASKRDYLKTQIIDLKGENTELVKQLATQFKGEVLTQLPEGEKKPETDLLIIVGK